MQLEEELVDVLPCGVEDTDIQLCGLNQMTNIRVSHVSLFLLASIH